jgi:hypothetical protein
MAIAGSPYVCCPLRWVSGMSEALRIVRARRHPNPTGTGGCHSDRSDAARLGLGLPVAGDRDHHGRVVRDCGDVVRGRRRWRLQRRRARARVPEAGVGHRGLPRRPVPDPDRLSVGGVRHELHRADRLGRHPDPAGRLRQRLWPRGARPVREHRPGVGLPAVRAVVRRGRPAHVPKRLGRHELRGAAVQRLDRGHRVLPGAPDRAVEPERVLLRRECEQPGHAAQPGGHRQRQHRLHGEPRPALQRGDRPRRPEPCQVRCRPHVSGNPRSG